MLLEQINPRFRLGESNRYFCDCLGLTVFWMQQHGFKCTWEKEIKRVPTNYEDFCKQLNSHNFYISRPARSTLSFVTWKNPDQTGHIGVLYENKVYHMKPEGVQIKLYQNEQVWYYLGD